MTNYTQLLEEASKIDLTKIPKNKQAELLAYLDDVSVKAARENFYVFVKLMAPERIRGTFRDGLHIRLICAELQLLYEAITANSDGGRKKQVFLPPESMKTELCTIMFPVWCLGRDPSWRILAVAHGSKHAAKFLGKPAKELCRSEIYRRIFPKVLIDKDSKANDHWNTTFGGGYVALGVGAGLPGKRANLTICDDVISEQTAYSKQERATINDWVGVGLETRLLEGMSGQLVVNTRWHLDDISGFLEKRDKASTNPWKVVSVPAILDQPAVDMYKTFLQDNFDEVKYSLGGSYWPEHKPLNRLLEKKAQLPPHHWAACYQQSPIAEEGSLFKTKHFQQWNSSRLPECISIFAVFDTAFTEEERKDAARSAYTVWGVFKAPESRLGRENNVGSMLLLGAEAGYWSYPELLAKCEFLRSLYKKDLDFFLVEKKASGISLIQDLRARGWPVVEYMPDRSKEARAWAAVPLVEAGRVWIDPSRQFTKEFLTEILGFPFASLKDLTDTFVMAVLYMRDQMMLVPKEYTIYEDIYEDNVVNFKKKTNSYWDNT